VIREQAPREDQQTVPLLQLLQAVDEGHRLLGIGEDVLSPSESVGNVVEATFDENPRRS
jgi:hypothetical protein